VVSLPSGGLDGLPATLLQAFYAERAASVSPARKLPPATIPEEDMQQLSPFTDQHGGPVEAVVILEVAVPRA
jgi:hypothetical protein